MSTTSEQLEAAQARIQLLEQEVCALREVLHHMPHSTAVFDDQMRYIGTSERFVQDYNIVGRPILGHSHYEVFPDIPQRWMEIHQRVLTGSVEHNESDWFEREDGSVTYNQWECRPWYTPDNRIGGLIMYTDVVSVTTPKERRLEQEQGDLQRMLQLVLDAIPARVFWKDRHSRMLGGNRLLLQDWGFTSMDQLIGRKDADFFPENAQQYIADDLHVMLTGEPHLNIEEPITTRAGERLWVQTNKVPLRDATGSIIGVLGTYTDITQRKYAEVEHEKLLEQLNQLNHELEQRVINRTRDLELALEVSRHMTTVLDLDELLHQIVGLTILSFDLESATIFLYDENHAVLKDVAMINKYGESIQSPPLDLTVDLPATPAQTAALTRQIIVPDVETNSEIAIPMIWNQELIGVFSIQAQRDQQFTQQEIRVFQSLAEQAAIAVHNAQLFAEVKIASKRAEQSDKLKSSFLATVSHELRTPLNAIINFSKFVHRGVMGPVNDRQKETLEKVIKSSQHLLSLINDVLDISKIEANSLSLFVEDNLDMSQILQSAIDAARPLLNNKPVKFQQAFEPDLPFITGDRKRIFQVVLNILSNACKFTEAGLVRVTMHQQDGSIFIAVQDTGPGIAPSDQDTVFEAFKQTESGRRSAEGTGLGMAISYNLVKAHGGELWFESQLGQGTTFYVLLPIKPQA